MSISKTTLGSHIPEIVMDFGKASDVVHGDPSQEEASHNVPFCVPSGCFWLEVAVFPHD